MKRQSGMLAGSGNSFGIFGKTHRRALLTSVIIFFFLLMPLLWYASTWYEDMLIKDQKARDTIHLSIHGNALTTAVNERFALLDGLFAFTAVNPSDEALKKDFDIFATGLYSGSKGIRNFGLAPGGVMRYVYPLQGNEATIGHDLVNDSRPEVRADVQRAINTRKTALSGPYELRQDGLGLVARKALYVNNTFWGLVTMVIDMPPVFEEAGFYSQPADIEMALRGSSGNIFFGNVSVFEKEPVTLRIELPEGYWELGGIPEDGWSGAVAKELFIFQASGLIVSILIAIIIYLLISRYSLLEKKVQERTQELKESEEKFATIFKVAPGSIILSSLPDGKTVEVNDNFSLITGYSRDEAMGKTTSDLGMWADPDASARFLSKLQTDGFVRDFEADLNHKSGAIRNGMVSGDIVTIKGKKFLIGTFYDITERKRMHDALRESEVRMRSVFEQANDGIYIISAENRYLDANESGLELLGYTRSELLQMGVADVLAPHEVARLAVEPPKMMSGIPHMAEWMHIRKDGSLFPGEVSAHRLNDRSYLAIVRDLTERRRAEEKLRESEERLRLATELANVAVWEYSFITNSMSRSKNHDKLYGLEWQTKWDLNTFTNATHPDDREFSNVIIQKSVAKGGPDQYEFDFRVVYPDQSIHWLTVVGQVIERNSDGQGTIVRGSLIDITGRKKTEEELRKHREHLEELVGERTALLSEKTEQLNEDHQALIALVEELNSTTKQLHSANIRLKELDKLKSMFIASTSHELRTPLNSIIGFSSILLEGWSGELTPEQKEQIKLIHDSGQQLLALINDVIDISKIESGKLEAYYTEFRLKDIVDEAAAMLRTAIEEKGLALSVDVPDIILHSDRRRLLQCLLNYLSNAVKFSEKGSIALTAKTINSMIDISITDTGIGIQGEDIEKLFSPFVRLESRLSTEVGGTGLGLYLTKKLTEEVLGGKVAVKSTYGKGSTFSLSIPVKLEVNK